MAEISNKIGGNYLNGFLELGSPSSAPILILINTSGTIFQKFYLQKKKILPYLIRLFLTLQLIHSSTIAACLLKIVVQSHPSCKRP